VVTIAVRNREVVAAVAARGVVVAARAVVVARRVGGEEAAVALVVLGEEPMVVVRVVGGPLGVVVARGLAVAAARRVRDVARRVPVPVAVVLLHVTLDRSVVVARRRRRRKQAVAGVAVVRRVTVAVVLGVAVVVRGVLLLARAVARGRRGRRGGRGGRRADAEGQNEASHANAPRVVKRPRTQDYIQKQQSTAQWRFFCLSTPRGEFEVDATPTLSAPNVYNLTNEPN